MGEVTFVSITSGVVKVVGKSAQKYVSKKINEIINAKNQITLNVSGHKIQFEGESKMEK